MAEVFGIAAGALTVLELTTTVVKQCKTLIETGLDAPRVRILRFTIGFALNISAVLAPHKKN